MRFQTPPTPTKNHQTADGPDGTPRRWNCETAAMGNYLAEPKKDVPPAGKGKAIETITKGACGPGTVSSKYQNIEDVLDWLDISMLSDLSISESILFVQAKFTNRIASLKDKDTATGSGPGVTWGSTGMQGWRVTMEDHLFKNIPRCSMYGIFIPTCTTTTTQM